MDKLSSNARTEHTKFRAGKYMRPVTMIWDKNRIYFKFGYNKILLDEIKSMEDAKWHGYDDVNPRKMWSVKASNRNIFNIEYLEGLNPFEPYTQPLKEYTPSRGLYNHQIEAVRHGITRKQCIYGGEMGVGKTLAAIEIMEYAYNEGVVNWLWVGPRSAINAVKEEFRKWNASVIPVFSTYSSLSKLLNTLNYVPHGVVFDECSRIKNPTTQRSKAAMNLAEDIRTKYARNGYIFLMSGTPAPKNPTDWWWLSEVACPGYLKEGTITKFKRRLAVIEQRESITGGVYPALVTWRNDESLCNICGLPKDDDVHDPINMSQDDYHIWQPSVNEVKLLGERLKGLTIVHFKKDCLDLPDKIYRIITCPVDAKIKRAMGMIKQTSERAITALTLLRELSDGFQYKIEKTGNKTTCDRCKGVGKKLDVDEAKCEELGLDIQNPITQLPMSEQVCTKCDGSGLMDEVSRIAKYVGSPKEQVLIDVLEEHEDIGRLVVSAGFTGSINRIVEIVKSQGWDWCRIDGKGWTNSLGLTEQEMLKEFQDGNTQKLCWIMHPESGGMGVTLTASPTILVYSNDFKAENRIQMEDRIHRPGMDSQRGATIIDIDYLPTDALIRDNLQQKRDLQKMSMVKLSEYLK